jgi:hypothetical protein
MTFADKKIEELKDFTIQCKGLPVDSERGILDAKNSKGVEISNFIKQTIAEAERKGIKNIQFFANIQLSNFIIATSGKSPIFEGYEMACKDIIVDCQKKLKELGA